MAGLGKRGQEKVAKGANELFNKTENMESNKPSNEDNDKHINQENQPVKKSFVFSFALAEQLRKFAFEHRMKEVDIVREALDAYFQKGK